MQYEIELYINLNKIAFNNLRMRVNVINSFDL